MSSIWELPAWVTGQGVKSDVARCCCCWVTAHVNMRDWLWDRERKREQFVLLSCQDTFCSFLLPFTRARIWIVQFHLFSLPGSGRTGKWAVGRQRVCVRCVWGGGVCLKTIMKSNAFFKQRHQLIILCSRVLCATPSYEWNWSNCDGIHLFSSSTGAPG